MTQLPREKIDEVRDRTNISEVIARHVELKRAGTGSWMGLCPFHAEKSPSFHVNEQRQYFYCFGCGAKGDVFSFLQQIEHQSFMEVLRDLAQKAGVELPEDGMSVAERKALAEAETERSRLLRVMELAVGFFEQQLAAPEGSQARAYLQSRGLSPETAARFRVGYAPSRWNALSEYLQAQRVPNVVAERLGLVGRNERGGYDFFRDRVMLPVLDRQKRPVGFSSRLMDPEAKERKYVNSPDTPLFHKKEQLYGLHAAMEGIRRGDTAVLVEGNFDVMSLHDAGITQAVAPMGTALTAEQINILGRLARKVVVVFDGDTAGQRAVRRALPLFLDADIDGRVARMPAGLDPDDFVRQQGKEAFVRLIETARPMVEHFIDSVAFEADASVPGRVAALEEAAAVLAQVKNQTARELYAGRLAATMGLDSAQVGRAVRTAFNNLRRKHEGRLPTNPSMPAASSPPAGPARKPRASETLELEILAVLVNRPELAGSVHARRATSLITDPGIRAYAESALRLLAEQGRLDVPAWLDEGAAEMRDAVAKAVTEGTGYRTMERADHALNDFLVKLELVHLDEQIAMVARSLTEALARGDEPEAQTLTLKQFELVRQKKSLPDAHLRH